MTAVVPKGDHEVAPARPAPTGSGRKGSLAWKMLTTTDHKMLGLMYIIMAFCFFFLGGFMALLIRAELFSPGLQYLSNEQFNQLFTMHGTVMLLLYGTPVVWGFANYVMPLQIGAPDVAFPRLNAFGFWLTAVGGILMLSGFFTPGGAADFGWTMYSPLSDSIHSPGVGSDMWILGVGVGGIGTIVSANWAATSTTPPTAVPSCGSTCSGSSDTPRCTSWLCRSSALCLRLFPCSPVSRCSATRAWCLQPCPSLRCPWQCGRTTCSSPALSCCRSSPS